MIPKGSKLTLAALALLVVAAAPPPAAAAASGSSGSASGGPAWRSVRLGAERHPVRHVPPGSSSQRPRNSMSFGAGMFYPSDQPGDGLYMNGSFESEIVPQVDLGGQFGWYHRSVSGSSYVYEYRDPAGNVRRVVEETGATDTDLVPMMATLRVRFPVSGALEPYVGGGIGYEYLSIDGIDPYGYVFHDDYGGFGAQAFGGMNLRVTPTVALYGEAVWNESTVDAEFMDPYYGVIIREEVNFDGPGWHAGLRFRF